MKNKILFLSCILSITVLNAQSPKNTDVKNMGKSKVQITPNVDNESTSNKSLKAQLLGEWVFHEITLRTPRDGYLLHIAKQELNIIKLLIANYTFNKDGSITLDSKYIEKQGVKKASWKLSDDGKLTITYFWTLEKMKEFEIPESENKVELDYKVNIIQGKELTLSMRDMFIVNLIVKTKK